MSLAHAAFWMAAAALVLPATTAWGHANERAANTTGVVAAPGADGGGKNAPAGEQTVLAGLTFGAAIRPQGSPHFHWICEEALLGPTENDAMLAAVDARRLVYADAQAGIAISDDGGCNWRGVPGMLRPFSVSGLAQDAATPQRLYVVGYAQAAAQGALFVSDDAGASWRAKASAKPGVFFTAVATSSAAPTRVWLAGTNNNGHASGHVFISDDGGATLRGGPVAFAPAMAGGAALAVHPGNANTFVVAFLNVQNNSTQVLLTRDGGETYERVLLVRDPVRSMRFAADGTLVVAGVHQAFVLRPQSKNFAVVATTGRNACTGPLGMVCGDADTDHFALGTLLPDNTVRPGFALRSLVGPYHCPAGSEVATRCMPIWSQQAQRLGARIPAPKALPNGGSSR